MKFGESKCAYLKIQKGLIKQSAQHPEINNICIKPIKEGESYKYLGQDENFGYVGSLNKEIVTTEYKKKVRKIWSSELSAYNKHLAHNTFALPVLTPTFGILDWTIREIENLDITTRKILNMTGNFNRNSDIDRLYLPRRNGGRGLKNVKTLYESRIISISQHLKLNRERNKYLREVVAHEEDKIIRVAHELLNKHNIANENKSPKYLSKTFSEKQNENHKRDFMSKPFHGYITKTTLESQEIDKQLSLSWTTDKYITSHFESYAFAISEQEINTKDLNYRRNKAQNPTVYIDNKCRLCKTSVEDVFHILCSCPKMSSRYYLPLRHDIIAKHVFENLMKKIDLHRKITYCDELIEVTEEKVFWWNVKVKTTINVKNNRPDLIIWGLNSKECQVVEFSCPGDINVIRKIQEKENTYNPLLCNLQILYPEYSYQVIPIVIGALSSIPCNLKDNLKCMGFYEKEVNKQTKMLQIYIFLIVKSFLKFKC